MKDEFKNGGGEMEDVSGSIMRARSGRGRGGGRRRKDISKWRKECSLSLSLSLWHISMQIFLSFSLSHFLSP